MRYNLALDIDGICSSCGEHTSLAEACCGYPIHFEGGTLSPEDVYQNQNEYGFGDRFIRGVFKRSDRSNGHSDLNQVIQAKRSGNPWSDPKAKARAMLVELQGLPKPKLP